MIEKAILGVDRNQDKYTLIEDSESEDCVVMDCYAERTGNFVELRLWNKFENIKYYCPHDVRVQCLLYGSVPSYGSPSMAHTITVEAKQPFEVVLQEKNDIRLQEIHIKSVRLSGRMKALKQRTGLFGAMDETMKLCRGLGNVLNKQLGVENVDKLMNVDFIKDGILQVMMECPVCSGQAVYKYRNGVIETPEKECSVCGWRGYIELYDGKGRVFKIPMTAGVRDYLNAIGMPEAEDPYEHLFQKGIRPNKLIRELERIYKSEMNNIGGKK